jgi:membrane protein
LAYFWFLAFFPALLAVVALAAYLPVQDLIDAAVRALARVAPWDVVAIVRDQLAQITQGGHAGLLTFSLLGALWSSSSGMAAIISTLNQVYHVKETRSWWRVRALAIALTLALALLVFVSLALALVGPRLAEHLATSVHLGSTFAVAWKIAQWPLIFGLVVVALEGIYYCAPDVPHKWGWVTPGSLAAAILGLLLSLAFSWYAGHFGDYQKTYGTIGGVIVALLWLYGSGLAILIGAELNAAIEQAPAAPRLTSARRCR